MTSAEELVGAAEAALVAGDFVGATDLVLQALEFEDLPRARYLLGGLCYAEDRYPEAVEHFQRAFVGLRAAGELQLAARAAMTLGALQISGLGHEAVGRGWAERARALLEEVGPCVEWGYLELYCLACDRTDLPALLASTERALAIAREHADVELEAVARADRGLALVTQGRLEEGWADLDAALTALLSGEVPPRSAGICFCSMLTACDRAGDVRRAEEWSGLVRALTAARGDRPKPLHVHCRVAWGSVLRAAGRWQEAEQQLLEALGPEGTPFLSHRGLTCAHLAGLRIDQGRLEEAAALLEPYEDRVSSSAPLALLHLRRGHPDLAAAVCRRALAELVDDTLRMVPVLAALVQVEFARGALEDAWQASASLAALAERYDVAAVRAEASLAAARVTRATGGDARPSYVAALRDLEPRPFQAGLVRLELAESLTDRDEAVVEARSALACFLRLGATEARDRTTALLRSLGHHARPQLPGSGVLTEREGEVLALLEQGLSNTAIGRRLFISPKTAEHHVSNILAKLGVRSRAEAVALGRGSG